MSILVVALALTTHLAAAGTGDTQGDVLKIPPPTTKHTPDLVDDVGTTPARMPVPTLMPIAVTPDAVVWKPGPPSLPPGTQSVVLEGDPTKPEIVTMRLKIAPGFKLAMHTHPAGERVTVLSGTMRVTYFDDQGGTAAAQTHTKLFPAGSFYVTPKGMPHHVRVDEETVIQITVQGPWGVDYVNAKDDPRNKK